MGEITSYRDLLVWQKAMDLAVDCQGLSKLMPKQEEYRLTSQLLRAAVSVPANIAVGGDTHLIRARYYDLQAAKQRIKCVSPR